MSTFILEDAEGLVFYRVEDVAAITPEFEGRYRVVAADGTCGTRPFAPPPGPWVPLGPSMVHPRLLRPARGGYLDPHGFFHQGELKRRPPSEQVDPWDGDLPCEPDQVIQLLGKGENGLGCVWVTDVGEFPEEISAVQASREHPCLIQLRRGQFVNLRRFRRILRGRDTSELVLDNGLRLPFHNTRTARLLAERLGLPHLRFLEPRRAGLYRYNLRDWPFLLATAPSKVLREHFQDVRVLVANLVWQVVRYRQMGVETAFGKDYRDFWYDPLVSALWRAGFLTRARWRALRLGDTSDELFDFYQDLVGEMVGDDRLFNFAQLGFSDPAPELRHLGTSRPHIVVVAEKKGLKGDLQLLADEFGVSYIVLGGMPSLVSSEFFARAFAQVGPLVLVAYVDYDVGGHLIAENFLKQLQRLCKSISQLRYLVKPECFSALEIELHAMPCPASTPALRTKAKNWVKNGGGIDGQPVGIHCNHLKPFARVRERFVSFCGDLLD